MCCFNTLSTYITMYKEKIKIYLSARISKDAQTYNKKVCSQLESPIEVFLPQEHNPWNINHKKMPKKIVDMDIQAMKESDMCLLLPDYGRDCAYEIGWYSNSQKPIVVFIEAQTEWLRDWMVKGGVNYIITNNKETYWILKEDPILSHKKILHIQNIQDLNTIIKKIYVQNKKLFS